MLTKAMIMKKQILLIALILSSFCHCAQAQVGIHFNIGLQPLWGPTGYDYAQYYYIPDIDAYYDVANQQYVYFDDGRWIYSSVLPPRYAGVDLYRVHKVVVNQPSPWLHHERYHNTYYSWRGRYDQPVIRDARDHRYWENPNHPNHYMWHGSERSRDWGGNRPHDNGRHEGWDRGHDNGRHEGWDRGHDNGRHEGWDRGHDNGRHEGHDHDRH